MTSGSKSEYTRTCQAGATINNSIKEDNIYIYKEMFSIVGLSACVWSLHLGPRQTSLAAEIALEQQPNPNGSEHA